MGKLRLPYTPNSIIRSALRKCWLRSRERTAALKRSGNCCTICGKKASKAKGREIIVDVHHTTTINWEKIFTVIRQELLIDPEKLLPMCEGCHDEHHAAGDDQG